MSTAFRLLPTTLPAAPQGAWWCRKPFNGISSLHPVPDGTSEDSDVDTDDDEDDIVIVTVLPRRGPKHGHRAPSATTTTNPRASDPDTTQAQDQPDQAPAVPHIPQPDPNLAIIAALGPKGWGPPPPPKHTYWVETVAHRGLSSLDHEELGAVATLDRPQDGYVFPNRDYNWGEFVQFGLVWEVSDEDGKEYLVPKLLQHVRLDDCPPFYCPVATKMIDILQAFRNARNDDCWH